MQITLTPVSISSAIFAGFDDYRQLDKTTQQYVVNPNKIKLKFAVRCSAGTDSMYSAIDCYKNKWFISMKVDRNLLDEFLRRGIKDETKGNLIYLCKSLVPEDKKESIDYFQYLDFQPEAATNNVPPPKMPATASTN